MPVLVPLCWGQVALSMAWPRQGPPGCCSGPQWCWGGTCHARSSRANVAVSRLGAGLGFALPLSGPSLPRKTLPGSIISPVPYVSPACVQWMVGAPWTPLGVALGAGTWEQYLPCEPYQAAVSPPCPWKPEPCNGELLGPRKASPQAFPITLQLHGSFRAPHQPTTWQ